MLRCPDYSTEYKRYMSSAKEDLDTYTLWFPNFGRSTEKTRKNLEYEIMILKEDVKSSYEEATKKAIKTAKLQRLLEF